MKKQITNMKTKKTRETKHDNVVDQPYSVTDDI